MDGKQWKNMAAADGLHVIPLEDLREHDVADCCWCCPRVRVFNDRRIVIHNSLDGREILEQGEERRE